MQMVRLYDNLPPILDGSINDLISAINSKQRLVDCEVSQVLGDINAHESYGIINSGLAKELRSYYIDDVVRGKYGQVL